MTPDPEPGPGFDPDLDSGLDPDKRARDRFAILMGLRAGGGALVLLGLWMLLGGSLGGAYGFGAVLMVMGFVGMIVVPKLLARAWRTPR